MSSLTYGEKLILEKAFDMDTGYVLGFSNPKFQRFVYEATGKDIYTMDYEKYGGSKGKRLKCFWEVEPDYIVAKLLNEIFLCWDIVRDHNNPETVPTECRAIAFRLSQGATVSNLETIEADDEDENFGKLANSIRKTIEGNKPYEGIDRLHTYTVKFFRKLCKKHDVEAERDVPLHSLSGLYVKKLEEKNLIQSEVTKRILKTNISIMDAFNGVRNNESFAHDNDVLNYEESLFRYGNGYKALKTINSLNFDLEALHYSDDEDLLIGDARTTINKLYKYVGELKTYISNNSHCIPNYGEKYRNGERISTGFVESTINQVVSKRFSKKQQMRWTKRGAHLLLQTRTKVFNDDLEASFRNWYPTFKSSASELRMAA